MKEILLILSMLLLGIFSAKAFGMEAYTPTQSDNELVQSLDPKIQNLATKNPTKLLQIEKKIPILLSTYTEDTRVGYILSEVLLRIQSIQEANAKVVNQEKSVTQTERSQALTRLVAEQF